MADPGNTLNQPRQPEYGRAPAFGDLAPLVDRAALWVALRQDAFEHRLEQFGDWRWDMNVQAARLTFTSTADPSRRIETKGDLIASIAPGPRSLLWAWALPHVPSTAPAHLLRAHGETTGPRILAQAEVPFPELGGEDPGDFAKRAAQDVGVAACELLGRAPFFAPSPGGGTRAVIVLDTPVEPLTVQDAVVALPRLLASGVLRDPRTAVWGLARHAGWQLAWDGPDFTAASVTDGSVSARFSFDRWGRITQFGLQTS
ncbi:DUF6882 domain-containing protein [Propionicicella superfundia]|uniref:DUF6882 domain-containing protein n=1 Tax=Propionicicella superfundia TaxID=348582 RepID=UPI000423BF50|nr:DUF6882 domain-containing protein [Propionicicella superfundia]